MKNRFQYNEAEKPAPIRIEQVWAEKPGGGLLLDAGFDVPETTAAGLDTTTGKYKVIKSAKVHTKYAGSGTTIVVQKGSGFKQGEFIAFGKIAKTISKVDTSNAEKDTITIDEAFTGVNIEVGEHLFQATKDVDGSKEVATAIVKPVFIVAAGDTSATNGIVAFAGNGDTPVRLINGANVRKETCNFGADIEEMMSGVHRV